MSEKVRIAIIRHREGSICAMAIRNVPPPLTWVNAWLMLRFGLKKQEA